MKRSRATGIGELRDALWHELPRDVALRMDREDGLPADRGWMEPSR
jgi:hypothetical protein